MNRKIYIQDWLKLKPYDNQVQTDRYYLKVSNKVLRIMTAHHQFVNLREMLDREDIKLLSCFLTSYFEDVISETGVWSAFVRVHQKMYGKPLPFYEVDEYFVEEINFEDVCFLIWYFFNSAQDDMLIYAHLDFIKDIAKDVYELFDKEWDRAFINEDLKAVYQLKEEKDQVEDDYYYARRLIDKILFETYLFYIDTKFELDDKFLEVFEKYMDEDSNRLLAFFNIVKENILLGSHTKLLALSGKEWAAEILGEDSPRRNDLLTMSNRLEGDFLFKGQDTNHIFIEHIASRKEFKLTKKTLDQSFDNKELDTIIHIGMVRWRNEWWFSGIYFESVFNAEIVEKERNSMKGKMAVAFLDHEERKTDELLQKQLALFKEFNNGSQIAFLPTEKTEEFSNGYLKFYNNSLNVSIEEAEKAKKKIFDGDMCSDVTKERFSSWGKSKESSLIFFNPKSGIEIANGVNSAFPYGLKPFL